MSGSWASTRSPPSAARRTLGTVAAGCTDDRGERGHQEARLEGTLGRDPEVAERGGLAGEEAAITAAATVVPTERISALMPTAEAASFMGTASMISVGIAAYPMPTPAEQTQRRDEKLPGRVHQEEREQVAEAEHGGAEHEGVLRAEARA